MRRTAAILAVVLISQARPLPRRGTHVPGFVVKRARTPEAIPIWIPLAHDDPCQQISILSAKSDLPLARTRPRVWQRDAPRGRNRRQQKRVQPLD